MALLTHKWAIFLAGLLITASFAMPVKAQNIQLAEQKIKAGMVYNFLKYTDWPTEDAVTAMTVCVFDDDSFADSLHLMEGRSVNQRLITVKILTSIKAVSSCQLVIVDKKESWSQLRGALAGKSVLTVGDYEGFADAGGMIEFGHADNHITVELNPEAVAASRLSVQERLRSLMTLIRSRP